MAANVAAMACLGWTLATPAAWAQPSGTAVVPALEGVGGVDRCRAIGLSVALGEALARAEPLEMRDPSTVLRALSGGWGEPIRGDEAMWTLGLSVARAVRVSVRGEAIAVTPGGGAEPLAVTAWPTDGQAIAAIARSLAEALGASADHVVDVPGWPAAGRACEGLADGLLRLHLGGAAAAANAESLVAAAGDGADPRVLALRAEAAAKQGRHGDSERLSKAAEAAAPGWAGALYARAVAQDYGDRGDPDRAYRRVLAVAPRHAGALTNAGLRHNAAGARGQALDLLRRAAALEPAWPVAGLNLALVRLDLGDGEGARGALAGLSLAPMSPLQPLASELRARARLLEGDPAGALRLLATLGETRSPTATLTEARARLATGDVAKAAAACDGLLAERSPADVVSADDAPFLARAVVAKAMAARQASDAAAGQAVLAPYLKADSAGELPLLWVAEAALGGTTERLQGLSARHATDWEFQLALGVVLERGGDLVGARGAYLASADANPLAVAPRVNAVRLLLATDDAVDAARALELAEAAWALERDADDVKRLLAAAKAANPDTRGGEAGR